VLARCLDALAPLVGGELLEVIVVDDGSGDGSPRLAADRGLAVLSTGGRKGPAAARNVGVEAARGEAVLFVDADVVATPEGVAALRAALAEPGVVAAFGSYDDDPPERNLASLYANLRHHHVHQRGAGEASTFWAGFGAVRRDRFRDAGGFDALRYPRPMIEDIELGYRLRARGGRIVLVAGARCRHLKRWTVGSIVRTDLSCRAVPWARLLLTHPQAAAALNVTWGERLRAGLAGLTAASLAAPWALGAAGWLVPAALLLTAGLANRGLVALVARRGGAGAAAGALLLHQLHYLYSSAAFVACWLHVRLGAGRPDPAAVPRRPESP